jgi:hypothetical protein
MAPLIPENQPLVCMQVNFWIFTSGLLGNGMRK